MAIEHIPLDGTWSFCAFPEYARRMRDLDRCDWRSAQVPGSVYLDLAAAGILDAAALWRHLDDFGWVAQQDWVWRRAFDLPDAEKWDRTELVFDGIDTVSQIWLNDKLLGKTDNMFIAHRFDVSGLVGDASNRLMVKIVSPLRAAERLMARYGALGKVFLGDPLRSYIRKAQYQFGSTANPPMAAGGIFAPVRICRWNTARLDDVCIRTLECDQHIADIRVAVSAFRHQAAAPLRAILTIDGGGLEIRQTLDLPAGRDEAVAVIRIERPILWHPHTVGVPHLYRLTVRLTDARGDMLDERAMPFGVCVIRARDAENPDRMAFEVNGQPVYIQGAAWLPLSMLPCQPTDADYRRVLTELKTARINLLRVWGGGLYERDIFYDLCDQLGILVWQDFMFASAYYPDRPFFAQQTAAEADAVIRRLRNHPSLALWCGNSHIDLLHQSGKLGKGKKFYGKAIFHRLLPDAVSRLDPTRDYIPSMPYGGAAAKDHNDPLIGPSQCWSVWNQYAPPSEYLFDAADVPQFLGEFGLQSLPRRDTLRTVAPAEKLFIGSPAIERLGHQTDAAGRLARYAAVWFAAPKTLDEWIAQTQLAQAKSAALCVEHLRARRPLNTGAMLWTATEPMPAIGFSMLDAAGWPKALYYYARRFFAARLITALQNKRSFLSGALTDAAVVVVNDHPLPLTATVECRCIDFLGRVIDQASFPVSIAPFSQSPPRPLPRGLAMPPMPDRCALYLAAVGEKGVVADNALFYLPPKYLVWPPRQIAATLTPTSDCRYEMTLSCDGLAVDVEVIAPMPARISDNFFVLLPHQPKTIVLEYDQPVTPSAAIPQVVSVTSGLP